MSLLRLLRQHGLEPGRTIGVIGGILVIKVADWLRPPAPVHGYTSESYYGDND